MDDIETRTNPIGAKRATIDDVAAAAQVSVATVSRALRGLPNVADSTRRRVLEVAESLAYRADPHASRLAAGRTMTVALAVPLLGRWYFSQVVAAAEAALATEGYDVMLFAIGTEAARHRMVASWTQLSRRVDAVILVDLALDRSDAGELVRQSVPVVTIGTRQKGLSSVVIDNIGGAATATRHLIDLGHRRIGLIGGESLHSISFPAPHERRAGYRQALAEAGIDVDPALDAAANFSVASGAAAAARLLATAHRPTAVFAMSDEMAFGVLQQARTQGVRVPEELSVIGFDGHELAEVVQLSTVSQPVAQTGVVASRLVLAALRDPGAPEHVELPTHLVARSTTGPPTA